MYCSFDAFQLPFILSYQKIDALIFTLVVVDKDDVMFKRIIGKLAALYQPS
jgi:hypothetical protein